MNKWGEMILGLVLIVASVLIASYFPSWLSSALVVLKGAVLWGVLGIGLILLLLGISELKG